MVIFDHIQLVPSLTVGPRYVQLPLTFLTVYTVPDSRKKEWSRWSVASQSVRPALQRASYTLQLFC